MASRSTSLTIEVLTDASKATQGLTGVAGKVDDLTSGIGKKLAGVAIGAAFVKFGSDAVKAAADAEQAVGGVAAVFKGQASQIEAAAKGAAKSIGLSTTAYENLATILGSQLKTAGFDDIADKTKELIGIGADLAAMYGGTTKDAVAAISSLMRGERDPIERYGIAINDLAIKAEIAALGLDTSSAAALRLATAQASLSLLTKQSADATGAAAREQDSAAARYQQFTATVENLEAAIGSALLPALSALADLMINSAPAVQALGEGVAGLVAGFAALPGPVLVTFAALGALLALPFGKLTEGLAMSGFAEGMAQRQGLITKTGGEISKLGLVAAEAAPRVKTLGASLLSAFGGPVGIAIAAFAGFVAFAIARLKGAETATTDFSGAIDELTGKLSAAELAKLVPPDTLKNMQAAGVAAGDYTLALSGNEDAVKRVQAALEGYVARTQGLDFPGMDDLLKEEQVKKAQGVLAQFGVDMENAGLATSGFAAQQKEAAGITAVLGAEVKKTGSAATVAAAAQKQWSDAVKVATDALKTAAENTDLSKMLADAEREAADAARALDGFRLAVAKVDGQSRSLVDTQNDVGAALDKVKELFTSSDDGKKLGDALTVGAEALRDFNTASLSSTSAGRNVTETLLAMKDAHVANYSAAYTDALAHGDVASAQTAARDAAHGNYQALLDQITGFVGSEDAARDLLKQLGILDGTEIDDKTFTTINQDAEARKKLTDMQNAQIQNKVFDIIATDLASAGIYAVKGIVIGDKVVTVTVNDHEVRTYKPDPVTGTLKLIASVDYSKITPMHFDAATGKLVPGAMMLPPAPAPSGFVVAPTGRGLVVGPAPLALSPIPFGSDQPPPFDFAVPLEVPAMTLTGTSSGKSSQVVNVTYNLTVNGALDADATARQINSLLRSRDRRALSVTARRGMGI